ncbi:MAG: rod shape-determining protein MreC [Clostridium sp.]|nr:rod shape-determining protein MreC [Clostridium sp.]
MEFHDKKEIPPKYIYLFLAVICFILLFFSVIFESKFTALKKVTSTIITPMQAGINEIGTSIYNDVTNRKTKRELMNENKELSAKLDEYSAQIKEYEQKNYELKRLQELLNLQEQYAQYHTIGARVIATDSTNWFSTFIINKGTKDGVRVGCNILADGGLAGIVTEAGDDYAKVRSIIDDNSNVSATISGEETLCTVSGDLKSIDNGYINVGYINKAEEIAERAELVTSHVSDLFLPGLLIGYITEIELDANNLTKSAKCIPVVDFRNLQEVLVVLDLKEDYQTDSENKNIYDSITTPENTDSSKGSEASTENEATTEGGASTENEATTEGGASTENEATTESGVSTENNGDEP